jgi:hypothetical protein
VEPHLPLPNRWPLCKWFEQLEYFLVSQSKFVVVVVSLFFFFTWGGKWWLTPNQHLDGYHLLNTPPAGSVWKGIYIYMFIYWVLRYWNPHMWRGLWMKLHEKREYNWDEILNCFNQTFFLVQAHFCTLVGPIVS